MTKFFPKWLTIIWAVVLAHVGAAVARGADWPQFRADAQRSAVSSQSLASELRLSWIRRFGTPRPAFPAEVRLAYDATYEPVVAGGTVFVPSMVTDSVTALDLQTGEVRWRFYADGPVRFAPVVWESGVYFVSDDGFLYCVSAADGALRWKFRGLPPGRRDRKLLGSGRLISLFPARGGPVVHEGVLYFGAGIWSKYGAGVYALDPRSGKLLWANTDSNQIPKANMDHGVAHLAGIVPQGYLAVVNNTLVVPCGAQLPAFFDLKTGTLGPYTMGWGGRNGLPKGTWFVAGTRRFLSHGGDLYDMSRLNDERFDERSTEGPWRVNFKPLLYPGGFTRVWIDPTNQKDLGDFDQPVLAGQVMYTGGETLRAYDLSQMKLEDRRKMPVPPARRTDTYPDKWQMACPVLWELPTKLRPQLLAGRHLYLAGPGTIEAVRIPQSGEAPQVVWHTAIEGTPHRILAADGHLLAVTREGTLLAFAEHPVSKDGKPVVHDLPKPPAEVRDHFSQQAADILQIAGARQGYGLVLGLGTGRLAEELVRQSGLHLIVIDRDATKIDQLRRRFDQAGWYGTRVSALVGEPLSFPLPPYLADLIVTEDEAGLSAALEAKGVEALVAPLHPYGGTACLALPEAARHRVARQAGEMKLDGVAARQAGRWLVLARPGGVPESGQWTHEEADAANSGASQEMAAAAPLELLWFDTPRRWIKEPRRTLVRICAGRMFLKGDKLEAVDVYTGRRLWEVPLPFSPSTDRSADQLVALADAVYLAAGRVCLVLDPATGETKGRIELPEDLDRPWANLRVWDRYLVGQSGSQVVCFDRHTAKLLWRFACGRNTLSIAVSGGKVFCSEVSVQPWGKAAGGMAKTRAIDLARGGLVWETSGGGEVRYSAALDVVVAGLGIYRAADGMRLASLPEPEVKPGKKVSAENLPRALALVNDKVLFGTAESFAEYDLRTGKPLGKPTSWTRRGCTVPRASYRLLTTRVLGNAACIDLASRQVITFWNVRAACSNNLFPAEGLLNMPSLTGGCTCNYLPVSQAFVAAGTLRYELP